MIKAIMLGELGPVTIAILAVLILVTLLVLLVVGRFIKIWIQAFSSGARVSFFDLIGMWLRKVPPQLMVSGRISAVQAGLEDLSTRDLESVFLVRRDARDVLTCVNALIIAFKAGVPKLP